MTRIEIDGVPPAPDRLWATVSAYDHFTALQVRVYVFEAPGEPATEAYASVTWDSI